MGLVFNIQKYSVNDGPGIRTTVFLKGCPLCCEWCHNPESISPEHEIIVVESRCVACGQCRQACPFAKAISGTGVLPTRSELCDYCGKCVEACPTGARQMVGREMTVAQVMAEILKDRIFYEDSGGGATFSGGEPLLQSAFVIELLDACRARGIHTAVDTCGSGRADALAAMARLADLFLYDIKFMDDARHREHCGVSNRLILDNLQALSRIHSNIWIRVPVIPGVNDDGENLSAVAKFVASLQGIRQVNLLPYHKTGIAKHARVGSEYDLADVRPPSVERMNQAADLFRAAGLNTRIGGN